MAANHKIEEKQFRAGILFRRGFTVDEIAEETGIPRRTLYKWRERLKWDEGIPAASVEEAVARRLCLLLDLPDKSRDQIAEQSALIERFGALCLDLARARELDRAEPKTSAEQEHERHSQYAKKGWKERKKKQAPKNDISGITPEMWDRARDLIMRGVEPADVGRILRDEPPAKPVEGRGIWGYLALWYRERFQRNRFILKSRQIGATYWFAWEAFEDAGRNGDNQIFLSASRGQAEVFRSYIVMFAALVFGIELKGNPIILSNGAELRFLSTNSRTAQSYHGHLYLDEVFWVPKFREMWKVASGMAAHKKWRRTLISTPSALSHEAYAMWGGEQYNKGKKEGDKVEFDVSHKALKNGWLGPDRIWRHMVTVKDAEAQGCDLFDIEELQEEYSDEDFRNLFVCEFIDDAKSVFPLWLLLQCCEGVDPDDWEDYQPGAARPFGNKPVSLGYDPARTIDRASLAKLAIPLGPKQKWRVLERLSFLRQNFQFQANRIKEITESHKVDHLAVDASGMGLGLFEHVAGFYPNATPIVFNVRKKSELVNKALEVMHGGRFQYSSQDREITRAFMMIRQSVTDGTSEITYTSGRSDETGHAEAAWAIMLALSYEPLAATDSSGTTVAFSN